MPNIQELIQKGATDSVIEAREIQERIRFHCNPKSSKVGIREHLKFARSLQIDSEKVVSYKRTLKPPLRTCQLASDVFSKALRVFNTSDFKVERKLQGKSLVESTDLRQYFKSVIMNVLRTHPYSYIVVDNTTMANGEIKTIHHVVNIDHVVAVEERFDNGVIYVDWILFELEGNYHYFNKMEWKKYNEDGLEVESSNHDLGVCPCVNIWHDFVDFNNLSCKHHVFFDQLTELDKFLLMYNGRFVSNLMDYFPIIWAYKEDRGIKRAIKNSGKKDDEFVTHEDLIAYHEANKAKPLRFGSKIDVTPPTKQGSADLRDPLGRIESDVDLMKHTSEALKEWEAEIVNSVISGNLHTDIKSKSSAMTATEITAVLSSRADFMRRISTNVQKSYNILLNLLESLERGGIYKEYYHVDMGNDFFLLEDHEVLKMLDTAKKVGLGSEETLFIYRQYIHSKHSKDEKQQRRAMILSYIEPLPYMSVLECQGVLDDDDFRNKVYFNEIITKFELSRKLPIEEYKPELKPSEVAKEVLSFNQS